MELAPDSETAVYKVVLPTVLVIVSEPEVLVIKTGSVVYGEEEAPEWDDSETAVYRVVLPTVLVMVSEPEVLVTRTGSVVKGVEEAPAEVALAPVPDIALDIALDIAVTVVEATTVVAMDAGAEVAVAQMEEAYDCTSWTLSPGQASTVQSWMPLSKSLFLQRQAMSFSAQPRDEAKPTTLL